MNMVTSYRKIEIYFANIFGGALSFIWISHNSIIPLCETNISNLVIIKHNLYVNSFSKGGLLILERIYFNPIITLCNTNFPNMVIIILISYIKSFYKGGLFILGRTHYNTTSIPRVGITLLVDRSRRSSEVIAWWFCQRQTENLY